MQTSNKTSVSALTSTGINPFGASFLSARLRIGLPRFAPALLGAVVAVACSTSALAQTEPTATATWTNTTSGTWGTTGNWSPAGAQNGSSTSILLFNSQATSSSSTTTTNSGVQTLVNALEFGGTNTGAITVLGGVAGGLTFVTNSSTSAAPSIWDTSSAAVTIALPITLQNNLTITNTSGSSAALTLSAGLVGSGNLTLSSTNNGPVILTSLGTYTGTTTISGGTLQLGAANAAENSTIAVNATNGLTFASAITSQTIGGLSGSSNEALTNLGSAAVALTVGNNNAPAAYSGILSGAGSTLTKIGTGVQTLSGANTYSGTTTVNGGALNLDFANSGSTTVNIIGHGANGALVMGGGALTLTGQAGATSQTFTGTTFTAGTSNAFTVNSNAAAGSQLLALGTITRGAGSTVNYFSLPPGTQSGTNGITASGSTSTNGILVSGTTPYATVGGNDWAAVSSGNVVGLSSATGGSVGDGGYTVNQDNSHLGTGGAVNADFSNANPTVALAAGASPTSIRMNNSSADTLYVNGQILQTGGILVGTGVGSNTNIIGGGTLEANTSGGELTVIANSGTPIISSVISNNGTASALTIAGTVPVTLTGANNYTGATYVNTGAILNTTGVGQIGSGTITNNGTINLNGSGIYQYQALPAVISGTGALNAGAINLTLSAANTYTGTNTFTGTNVLLTSSTAQLGNNAVSPLILNGNATISAATGTSITINGSNSNTSGGTTVLGTGNQLGSTYATGTLVFQNASVNYTPPVIAFGSAAAPTVPSALTFATNVTLPNNSGTITLNSPTTWNILSGYNFTMEGAGGFTKLNGAGSLTLTGGGTWIPAGGGSGGITFTGGTTLGNGTSGPLVEVNSTVTAVDPFGTGTLNLSSGTIYNITGNTTTAVPLNNVVNVTAGSNNTIYGGATGVKGINAGSSLTFNSGANPTFTFTGNSTVALGTGMGATPITIPAGVNPVFNPNTTNVKLASGTSSTGGVTFATNTSGLTVNPVWNWNNANSFINSTNNGYQALSINGNLTTSGGVMTPQTHLVSSSFPSV